MGQLLGYVCPFPTADSRVNVQLDALVIAGLQPRAIFVEHPRWRGLPRPGFRACLAAVGPGDTLVVWRLDRLGLTLAAIAAAVEAVEARGGAVRVLDGPGAAAWPAFRAWLPVFAACTP